MQQEAKDLDLRDHAGVGVREQEGAVVEAVDAVADHADAQLCASAKE